jgi:hypothetical protein
MQKPAHKQALHIRSCFSVINFSQNTPASFVQNYITTTKLHPRNVRKIKVIALTTGVVESAINSIARLCQILYAGTLRNNGNLLNTIL